MRQDSQSSPVLRRDLVLPVEKKASHPQTFPTSAVSHSSPPHFACGSANRGLQIWRFGFEETKKRIQLESSKDNT